MSSLLKKIADFNNLLWAWEKAKNTYRPGDIWFNDLEVVAFEADLSNELSRISAELLDGKYRLATILPIPYPKTRKEKETRTRQTFWVSVRDQVAWLAVVNIIGGLLDSEMPFWSYGNRLYLSMFFERNEEGKSEPRYGYYRNTNKHLFRKWTQSWPLYRRHVNLAARLLSRAEKDVLNELEEDEHLMIVNNERLGSAHPIKNAYIQEGYWEKGKKGELYWCGVDLEKFYPSINIAIIVDNFKKYFPKKYYSEKLATLFSSMLDFRIDYSGWEDGELDKIGLADRRVEFPHLPTGLFVSGFLANLAMLSVDKQLSKRLVGNKNIAHFRYVDDHVILASDYDQLLRWVEDYHTILSKSLLGTKFNYDKTEPKALGKYLVSVGQKDDIRSDLRIAAKVECTLDPDFPSPLMTQTLGKVSRIARTDFNLLTMQEEKNLVADVEHLLVTDFPDHELRKDTRVSFAARMLSSMIPRLTVDNSRAYQLHKNIVMNQGLIANYKEMVDKTLPSPEQEVIKNELKAFCAELKASQRDLKTEKDRLENEEKKLGQRTIKLLIKSVNDNHDKVRLWGRLMEFFQKTGANAPVLVLDQLVQLVNKGITNQLSISFLRSLVLQVTSNLLVDSIRIIHGTNYSLLRKERARAFLHSVLNDVFLLKLQDLLPKNPKGFESTSQQLFSFSAGTVMHLLNGPFKAEGWQPNMGLVKKYGLIDWENNPMNFISKSSFSLGTWSWWLYNRIPEPSSGAPFLWETITKYVDITKSTDLNLLLMYPKVIPRKALRKLDKLTIDRLRKNEGLLFDIYQGLVNKGEKTEYVFLKGIADKVCPFQSSITLYDWICWTNSRYNEVSTGIQNNDFDPRLGEWMALEMIRQVALTLKKRLEESPFGVNYKEIEYFRFIHPHNFKLPLKWKDMTGVISWENLREQLLKGKVEFRSKDEWVEENRYIPTFGLDKENQNQSILIALGSLLINLLAKNTDLPSKWNLLGLQQGWTELSRYKLKNLALSTFTRDIISACFSKRNVETKFNKRMDLVFSFDFDEDTRYDPPQFIDIADFIKYVSLALNRLRNQQLSVSNHQPRQLTPISLIMLHGEEYRELLKNEDIN